MTALRIDALRARSWALFALLGWLSLLGGPASAQVRKLSPPLARQPGRVQGHWLTPDGSWCVFLANPELQGASLFLVSLAQPMEPIPLSAPGSGVVREGVRLSKDGTRLVFTASGDLYSVSLGERSEPVRVAGVSLGGGTIQDRKHEVSPDGSHAVFWAERREGFTTFSDLYTVALDGQGGPVLLAVPQSSSASYGSFVISPDSARVVYSLDQDSGGVHELYSAPIDGSATAVKISGVLASDRDVYQFQLTADGTRAVYRSDQEQNDQFALFVAPLDGSASPRNLSGMLVPEYFSEGGVVLVPATDRVIFRAGQAGDRITELFSAPLDGSTPPVRLNATLAANSSVDSFRMTPDGTQVVYVAKEATDAARALHVTPADGSAPPSRLEGPPIEGSSQRSFRVSPDGARVLYLTEDSAGFTALYTVPLAAGGVAVPLAHAAYSLGSFEFSPDGTHVLYRSWLARFEPSELATVPVDGSAAPVVLGEMGYRIGSEGAFTFTPDSSSVVYRSDQGPESPIELYRAPIDASAPPVALNMPLLPGPVVGDASLVGIDSSGTHAAVEVWVGGWPVYWGPPEVWTVPLRDPARAVQLFNDELSMGMSATLDRSRKSVVIMSYQDEAVVIELWSGPLDGSRRAGRHGYYVDYYDSSASGQLAFSTYDQVFVVPLDGSARPRSLTGHFYPRRSPTELEITPDGTRVVFQVYYFSRARFELFSVPTDGSSPPVMLNGPLGNQGGVQYARMSPRADRVVYIADQDKDEAYELYSVPIDGSAAAVKLSGTAVSGGDVSYFVISPDGERVVFAADVVADGFTGLYSVPMDGSAALVELYLPPIPGPNSITELQITRNGKRVTFLADPEGDKSLELYSSATSHGPARVLNAPLVPGGSVQRGYQLAGEGRMLVYRADQDADEVFELYSVPNDGRRMPVKLNAALAPEGDVQEAFVLTPDGTGVVFTADARADELFELFAVPIYGGVEPRRLHPPLRANADVLSYGPASLAITPDSRCVLYVADADTDEVFELFESRLPPAARDGR